MLFDRRHSRTRRAFTLIELLTVIVIIGILAGLVTAAAIRVRNTVKKTTHALELKQLEMALHAYKERFGEFPPDGLPAGTFSAQQLFERHVRKAFPRCTTIGAAWSKYGQHLNPQNSLAFWLGGMYVNEQFTGFSANPADPFETTTTSRIGPFYSEFDRDRLVDGRYYPTVEARQLGDPNQAIVYYRAQAGNVNEEYDKKTTTDEPDRPYAFRDARTSSATVNVWINPRTFQIISPGLRGKSFAEWTSDHHHPYYPFSALQAPSEAQLDAMSNFMTGTLEDAMP